MNGGPVAGILLEGSSATRMIVNADWKGKSGLLRIERRVLRDRALVEYQGS